MGGRLALILGSVLVALAGLELACRLLRGPEALADWSNLVLKYRAGTRAHGAGRLVHDARLGFVARPGFASPDLNYDERSFRLSPASPAVALAESPILVVGDSFAHGDEVNDSETWPARLQPLARRRVVNAAMSGYGIDQMVLRAEVAAAQVKPAAIVLSFIADDVKRAEMRRVWGAEKPYFELVNGALVERNLPVPTSPEPATTLSPWHRLFGWSVLLDTVLLHQGWWYEWMVDYARVLPDREGERLACPLLKRLATLGLPTLVVAEYDPYLWRDAGYAPEVRRISGVVLKCAEAAGLGTLDLFETMDAGVKAQGLQGIYRAVHPSPAGTELAARRIAAELEARHIPPR